ncbi:MAG: DUF4936 family protein [Betaproteobacteria bacterium]
MADCYIYYRIDSERERPARDALKRMLAELQTSTQLVGHAYSKIHEPLLWMEVYPGIPDAEALVDLLTGLAERHGLTACLADNQRRHAEFFIPLDLQ